MINVLNVLDVEIVILIRMIFEKHCRTHNLLKINKVQLHYIHCNYYLEYIEVVVTMVCKVCTLVSY